MARLTRTIKPILVRYPATRQVVVTESPLIVLFLASIVCFNVVDQQPYRNIILLFALIIFLRFSYKVLYLKTMKYSLSSEELKYEHGVFHHVTDYLELYRVTDYQEDENFMQILLGLKNIKIMSGDKTNPVLLIIGLEKRDEIVKDIRFLVEQEKKKKKVYEITNR